MKNQYYGDINDYKKYGLLRVLCADVPITLCWMLTPDDPGPDGGKIAYLSQPARWRHYDPELFDHLEHQVVKQKHRHVSAFEQSGLLPQCRYFSQVTPDDADGRKRYFEDLLQFCEGSDLIFFDPDNGLEVKSVPFGRTRSSKYLYWQEVKQAWKRGFSLLIFQHFTREKREDFVRRHTTELERRLGTDLVQPIVTANVVFFLVSQLEHLRLLTRLDGRGRWSGQIWLAN